MPKSPARREGFVAFQLSFATVGVCAIASAAPAGAMSVIGEHGDWKSFMTSIDGRRVIGVSTELDRGGVAAIVVDDGQTSLLLMDESWSIAKGDAIAIAVTIDGETYKGRGTATSAHMIEASGVEADFVRAMLHGKTAVVAFGPVRWTLDLVGFTASLTDAVKAYSASTERTTAGRFPPGEAPWSAFQSGGIT